MSRGGNGGKWDFFISYSRHDRAWAEWIAWALEAAGYRVLIQAWDMVPGTNWVITVDEGIRHAERTIAVMSNAYLKSGWGRMEALSALHRDPFGRERRLLVVRIEDCSPDGPLGMIVRIDVFGLGEQGARQSLLDGIAQAARGHAKPTTPSGFPGTGHTARFPQGPAPSGEQRVCLALDIEGYRGMTADRRDQVRGLMLAMLFAALGRAGVQNSACVVIDRIDGLAVILPAGFTEASAMASAVRELCAGVADLGRAGRGRSPVRTRVGVAVGTVDLTSPTFEGSATATARLLASSGEVRVATARSPRTPNAVVVADDVYQTAHSAGLPTEFTRIPVSADDDGWISLIPGAAASPAATASAGRKRADGFGRLGAAMAVGAVGVALAAQEWQHLVDHEAGAAEADPALVGSAHKHPGGAHNAEPWQHRDFDADSVSASDSDASESAYADQDAPSHWRGAQWDDPDTHAEGDAQGTEDVGDMDQGGEFSDGIWGI